MLASATVAGSIPEPHLNLERRLVVAALQQHVTGDWGEVGAEDKLANDCAVVEGTRILSAYHTSPKRGGFLFLGA